jgi:hypothetical protein
MVVINLTWQAVSFFCASLFLSAFFLGGMINPELKYGDQKPLCLVCPNDDKKGPADMFFKNGATFVYHMISFVHFGGMGAGAVGLIVSLIFSNTSNYDNVNNLKRLLGVALPIVWVAAWGIQLIVLSSAFNWQAYDVDQAAPNIWLWWVLFTVSLSMVVALVVISSVGLFDETYVIY